MAVWTILVVWFYLWMFGGWDALTPFTGFLVFLLGAILGPFPGLILSIVFFPVFFPEIAEAEKKEREMIMAETHMAEREAWQASQLFWTLSKIEEAIDMADKHYVNVPDSWDKRMIEYAIEENCHDLVEGLINLGAKVNYYCRLDTYSPLCCAAEHSDGKMIDILCSNGARINERLRFSWTNPYMGDSWGRGFTALHFAAGAGNISTVKALIEQGAEINATTDYLEQTPLFKAVDFVVGDREKLERHEEVVNYLLDKGADPSIDSLSDNNLPDLNRIHQFAKKHGYRRLLAALS